MSLRALFVGVTVPPSVKMLAVGADTVALDRALPERQRADVVPARGSRLEGLRNVRRA